MSFFVQRAATAESCQSLRKAYHQEILEIAQREYYADPNAKPAKIIVYFANARGKKRDKQEMARNLVKFVKANVHRAKPIANFSALRLPEGLGSVSIAAESGSWWTGEGGNTTLTDIREALGSRISAKNKRVPTYRKNLAPGAQIWLLLYSIASVSRGMPIPHGIDEWRLDFDFDRVFWFACLENRWVEIQRVETARGSTQSLVKAAACDIIGRAIGIRYNQASVECAERVHNLRRAPNQSCQKFHSFPPGRQRRKRLQISPFNPNYPNEPECKLLKPKEGITDSLRHRPMLYQLSYAHHIEKKDFTTWHYKWILFRLTINQDLLGSIARRDPLFQLRQGRARFRVRSLDVKLQRR